MKVTLGKMTEFKREVDIVNDSTKVKGNVAVSDGNIMSVDNGVEEAQESMKDDKFEEMQRKLQECQQLEQKHADEGYEYTKDDSAKFAEVNEYFFNQKQKTEKYFSDLANAEVEVAIEEVEEKEIFKAAKDCGLKFADMESIEVLIG